MTVNFNPEYEFIVGRSSRLNNLVIPFSIVSPEKLSQGVNGISPSGIRYSSSPDGFTLDNGDYFDYNTIPGDYRSFKGLQLTASIPQVKEQGTRVQFEITGLSEDNAKFIKKDMNIIFRAAYSSTLTSPDQTLPDLFIGQVSTVSSSFNETERVTKIDCSEAQTLKRNSRISYHWTPGTTREEVIRTILGLINRQGVPTGSFTLPTEGSEEYKIIKAPYLSGYSIHGYTMEELTKICNACRLHCYTVVGKLYIEPKTITGNPPLLTTNRRKYGVFNITPDLVKGQISSRDGNSDKAPSNANGNNKPEELSFTTYFEARLAINKAVVLHGFDEFDGDYKVTSLLHKYDHRGGNSCETIITIKAQVNVT